MFHTHTKKKQNYRSVYLNLYIFKKQARRRKILHRMIATIPWFQSACMFFLNIIVFLKVCSQIFELFLPFKGTIINIFIVTSSCILILKHGHIVSAFSSKPISLLPTNKAVVFFFIVCTLPPSLLTSSALTRSWCVPFNYMPSWFTWTLIMAYSKAKLKSSGVNASPCFKPFLIRNTSDKCLPTRTLL